MPLLQLIDAGAKHWIRIWPGIATVAIVGIVAIVDKWVCLKMGYTPNYSHLVGIMISKTIGCRGTLFSDKPNGFLM